MVEVNRRFGRNVFWSMLLFVIICSGLFSGTAFCEEVVLTQAEIDYAQAVVLRNSQKVAESKAAFLAVAENSSGSELAMKSLSRAVYCEISLGDFAAADELFERIKKDYSTQKEYLKTIAYCANSYFYAQKYENTKQAYQLILIT